MSVQNKIKQKTREFIDSRHMLRGITIASFLESTIVPIPLEAVLIPLMQARREKLWLIAFMATLGCIAGALLGYTQFESVKQKMHDQGFWFVITLGIVPIPFQIAMLAAGATKYSLTLFIIASAIARSIRYFGLAIVVYYAGNQAERIISKHKTKTMIALTLLILTAWALSRML